MTLPLAIEPWVHIPGGRELENWGKQQEIEHNQQNRQAEKLRFFVNAFDFLTDNRVAGDYWEFGCHRARTFRMALSEARKHNLNMRFVAFDSFEGLPEPEGEQVVEIWKKGALCTTEAEFRKMVEDHGVYVDRVELVKGFYEDSLNLELTQRFTGERRLPALVNVDCDLYESAREVFRFLLLFVQPGLQIYLDDYYAGYKGSPLQGVRLAFREFENKLADKGMNVTAHMQVGWWGRSFIVY